MNRIEPGPDAGTIAIVRRSFRRSIPPVCLRSVLFLSILLFSFHGSLSAQENAIEKLSLKDAISMAMGVNVTLKRAEYSKLDSQSRLRVAGIQTTYNVNASSSFDRFQKQTALSGRAFGDLSYRNMPGTQADVTLTPFAEGNERSSIGLSLRHPLMRGKGMLSDKSNLVLTARSSSIIEDKNYYLARQSTVLNVLDAYYKVIEAQELVTAQEQAVTYLEEAAIYAQKREEAGLGRGIDVSRAEVQVAQAKDQLNLQRATAMSAMDRLMIAIGSGIGKVFDLTEPVPQSALPVPPLDEAIKTALTNRSELSIFNQQLMDQRRYLAMAKDKLRNGLDATASFNSLNGDTGALSGSSFDTGALRVGVEMKIPLDKRSIKEDRDVTARGLDILQKQKTFREEQVNEEVRQAYRSYESANTSLQIFSQNLSQAKENLRIAERMVEEGEGDNRDVLDAQSSLTRVTSSIVSARIDLYLASVNLRFAMGEDLSRSGQI